MRSTPFTTLRLNLLITCVFLCACIPIKWDNPAKDKIKLLSLENMSKSQVHELFGNPIITADDWNVEVYAFHGGEMSFIAFESAPAPLFLFPVYVKEKNVSGYILVNYDENVVKNYDYGSNQLDTVIDAGGFQYLIKDKTLLAPLENNVSDHSKNNICNLYFFSNINLEVQSLYIDNKYVGEGVKDRGYLLHYVDHGVHKAELRYKEYYGGNNVENLELTCRNSEEIFLKIIDDDPSWFKRDIVFSKSKMAPKDFKKRRQIIYQIPTRENFESINIE